MFNFRHVGRRIYPQKHVLICEDNLLQQKRMLEHFLTIFEQDGIVQVSAVCGALAASAIIMNCRIDLIILDHDMPEGNGTDLLQWLKQTNKAIPIITASGIPSNNTHMVALGAQHLFQKEEVINGTADVVIKTILQLGV